MGDELLWVDGHHLIGKSQGEAVELLNSSSLLVQLVVAREVCILQIAVYKTDQRAKIPAGRPNIFRLSSFCLFPTSRFARKVGFGHYLTHLHVSCLRLDSNVQFLIDCY